ncbi:MAG: hypothetical protein ACPGUE_11255 [Marinomonas sp.]
MSIQKEFGDTADWLQDELDYDTEELCMLVMEEGVIRSPVDTGRFRGNWIATVNKETDRERETAITANPIKLARDVLRRAFKRGESVKYITIQNNLPYAGVIDDGLYPNPPKSGDKTRNGYSKQAPQGISDLAIKAALERSK